MTWLLMTFTMRATLILAGGYDFYTSPYITGSERYEIPIEVKFMVAEHFFFGGKIVSMFGASSVDTNKTFWTFVPTGEMFYFFAGIRINDNISIIGEHLCEHAVISEMGGKLNPYPDGYTKISLEIKGDVKIF